MVNRIGRFGFAAIFVGLTFQSACSQNRFDEARLIQDIKNLSSDAFEGRDAGSPGGMKAAAYLSTAFSSIDLVPCNATFDQPFSFGSRGGSDVVGTNIVGRIPGSESNERHIVVTAHYDHVGTRNGEIYNGADDNASGAAALVAIAEYFLQNPPRHSIVIAALDAEERGLRGARAFLADPCVDVDEIALNVNMDMISRSESGELYASGTRHYPFLKSYLSGLDQAYDLRLILGHDEPGTGRDDWTNASDQGPFHRAGIPFTYFGVEDHEGYHRPGDDFEYITPGFYVEAVHLIIDALQRFDDQLDEIKAASGE